MAAADSNDLLEYDSDIANDMADNDVENSIISMSDADTIMGSNEHEAGMNDTINDDNSIN